MPSLLTLNGEDASPSAVAQTSMKEHDSSAAKDIAGSAFVYMLLSKLLMSVSRFRIISSLLHQASWPASVLLSGVRTATEPSLSFVSQSNSRSPSKRSVSAKDITREMRLISFDPWVGAVHVPRRCTQVSRPDYEQVVKSTMRFGRGRPCLNATEMEKHV